MSVKMTTKNVDSDSKDSILYFLNYQLYDPLINSNVSYFNYHGFTQLLHTTTGTTLKNIRQILP
jgi:hypothetical protein